MTSSKSTDVLDLIISVFLSVKTTVHSQLLSIWEKKNSSNTGIEELVIGR